MSILIRFSNFNGFFFVFVSWRDFVAFISISLEIRFSLNWNEEKIQKSPGSLLVFVLSR